MVFTKKKSKVDNVNLDSIPESKVKKKVMGDIPKMDNMQKSKFDDLDFGDDITIDKMMFGNDSNPADNVKELFGEDKVKARTDLTPNHIRNVTKAFYLAKLTGMPEIHGLLHDFLLLRISKDRKSRAEFVDGLKAKIEQGMMNMNNQMRSQFGK